MIHKLENNLLSVSVSEHGAEMQEIKNKQTGHQYLWHGDKKFWGRRSPVLFPIVGSLWCGQFKMDGKSYSLGQHGFVRDCDFTPLAGGSEDELWFGLKESDQTLACYPRQFTLEIGYRLQENRIVVMWKVTNTGDKVLDFQIGAHPAFNYPAFDDADPVHGYFEMGVKSPVTQLIADKGCIGDETAVVPTDPEGLLPLTADTFSRGALVLADGVVHRVSMLTKQRTPYLSVIFNSPLVGLWAPSPASPFVCIEPWWGRADSVGYTGEFADRQWVNHLAPGHSREFSYIIMIDNV